MTQTSARAYNRALLISTGIVLALAAAFLVLLDRIGRLPAPPLTATNCIDEKFKFLHETDLRSPALVAVGSSVTWRNLDLSVLEAGDGRPADALNAAPCYLHVHETAFLANFLVDNMPSVRTVLTVLAMRDLETCVGPGAFFDPDDARHYVFERAPAWHLYFLNFRPVSFVKDVVRLKEMRTAPPEDESLAMDRYGSSPMTSRHPDPHGNMVADPSCLTHLRRMAEALKARGVRLVVALLPPMPAWLAAYDPQGTRDRAWREGVVRTLAGTGAIVRDGATSLRLRDAHFTDPMHLQWPATPILTRWLVAEMQAAGVLPIPARRHAHAF